MMTLNTKLGVTLLAFFSTSGSAVAAAAADDNNSNINSKNQQLGRKRRTTTAKTTNLRKGNHRNNLATKKRQEDENNADITEDVAFWTRELQVGSMRPVTRRPTPRPTRRPTPNVTPNPVTPFPTEVGATPNPTDAATTPNPTDPADTPNPTTTPETPEPTPAPTVTITPAPSPTPPASGPVARDDDGVMNADDGIAFFSVLDNDTPAPGESLFVQSVDDGSNGLCTIGLDLLQVTFIPDVGFDGTDSCVYEACDSVGACDTATLTVVVEPPLAVAMWLSMPLS